MAITAAIIGISTIVLNDSIQIVSAQGPPQGNPQGPPQLINPGCENAPNFRISADASEGRCIVR